MKEEIYIKLTRNILYIVRLRNIISLSLIGMILIPNKMLYVQIFKTNLSIQYSTLGTFVFVKSDFMYIFNCWIHS